MLIGEALPVAEARLLKKGKCIDCWAEWISREIPSAAALIIPGPSRWRPARHPGPRCVTHHRAVRQERRGRAHEAGVVRTYGLGHGDYAKLYAAQGGTCAVPTCPATGRARRLAVDHDHRTGEVRGLLCSVHNRMIGMVRDNPAVFRFLADYIETPPARKVLGSV